MSTKRTAVLIILSSFIICLSGCATAGPGRHYELRTTEFQNTMGAAIVIAGMGCGAYAGSRLSDSGGPGFLYGVAGGLAGGAVVGLAYWGLLYLMGEKVEVGGEQETPKGDLNILLPKE